MFKQATLGAFSQYFYMKERRRILYQWRISKQLLSYKVITYECSQFYQISKLSINSANVERYIFTGDTDTLNVSTLVNWKGTVDFANWKTTQREVVDFQCYYLHRSILTFIERPLHRIVETNSKLVFCFKLAFIYMVYIATCLL